MHNSVGAELRLWTASFHKWEFYIKILSRKFGKYFSIPKAFSHIQNQKYYVLCRHLKKKGKKGGGRWEEKKKEKEKEKKACKFISETNTTVMTWDFWLQTYFHSDERQKYFSFMSSQNGSVV